MGFCYFNNVAVAAEEALAAGLGPVAVVDFDAHHGNGTQEHFWRRSDAFFLSVHRYPSYPGTGAGDEEGEGPGHGFTRNFPLAAGADDDTYAGAVEAGLEEIVERMSPHLWLVSAGFDAHRRDPIGGMQVSEAGFARIGSSLREAAGDTPVIAVLEGGYDLEALQASVRAFVEGLTGAAPS
jgi:acetoin utilization deacetylase AcuC-like enzyme